MNYNKSNPTLFFSMHRAGSTILSNILIHFSKISGNKLLRTDNNKKLNIKELNGNIFVGPIRDYSFSKSYDEIIDKNLILCLRDPRDVAVSMFFSFCYYHPGKLKPNTGIRKEWGNRGIDEFVKKIMFNKPPIEYYGTGYQQNLIDRYKKYLPLIESKDTINLNYELMVTNFNMWVTKLCNHIGIVDESIVNQLINKFSKEFNLNKTETITQHKRKIIPNQYKDKLSKETISLINNDLGVIIEKLGYKL